MVARYDDVEDLFNAVKLLRDERRKMQRLSEKARLAEGQKARRKATVDLDWQAAHVAKVEALVHARAVDCGLADLREPEHYRERISHNSPWHKYPWSPELPRALKEGLAK